jgi:hypothetical protein
LGSLAYLLSIYITTPSGRLSYNVKIKISYSNKILWRLITIVLGRRWQ